MGNLLVYSGITTKIRAMRSRLLSEKDFEEISALHNVPEVVAYLKNTRHMQMILPRLMRTNFTAET